MPEHKPFQPLRGATPSDRYVAFVDILVFGRRVLEEFDSILEVYQELIDKYPILVQRHSNVSVRVLSDAFVVTSETFHALVPVVQGLYMVSLLRDCLVRGGIGFGKHVESTADGHFIVVSQALVHAVRVEKSISHPCVAIHESVTIPDAYLDAQLHPLERGVVCFGGLKLICPFNHFWGHSAMTRVAVLYEENPQYSAKYDWFLSLYEAVRSGDPLVPER